MGDRHIASQDNKNDEVILWYPERDSNSRSSCPSDPIL